MQPDLEKLFLRYVAGERDPALIKQITAAVADDAELRDELRDDLALDRMLREQVRLPIDPAPVLRAIAANRQSQRFQKQVMAQISGVHRARRQASQHRRAWGWNLASAALLMIAIVGGMTLVLRPTPAKELVQKPVQESGALASVHYIRAVRWSAEQVQSPTDGARLSSGLLSLASGVIELRFDNAVVLALEGPLKIDVQSQMKVLLHRGRLATNVPPAAKGFTVATERFQVVDQGTEVGVDLAMDGQAQVHVISGAANIRVGGIDGTRASDQLGAGEARHFIPTADTLGKTDYISVTGTLKVIDFAAERFVRTGHPRPLAIDVADLIAGGDGRGTGTMAGLNPNTGEFQLDVAHYLSGPSTYHRVIGSSFIDGAFMLPGTPVPTEVNSLGSQFTFENQNGSTYDLIRRGGIVVRPPEEKVTKPTPSPTVIAGTDFATFGHQLIGMHASCGFTIDLQSVAHAYKRTPSRFTSILANTYLSLTYGPGHFVVLIDGRKVFEAEAPLYNQAPAKLDIPLTANDRFLTLVSTDGGTNGNGKWSTLADPLLMLENTR
jgi:NPCBM/NEW2 domain